MLRKQVKVFSVTETPSADSKEIFRGTKAEVSKFLNCSSSQIYLKSNREKPIFDKYYIHTVGVTTVVYPVERKKNKTRNKTDGKKPVKKISKKRENYLRILHCLDIYGNTSNSKDPIKLYGKDFEKDGYIVNVRYCPKQVCCSGYGEKDIYDELWIITLIKKVEVNTND